MSYEVLSDFEFYSKVPTEVIEKYKDKIPPELLDIWLEYGFGTFAGGYIKIINPDDYMETLEESYFNAHVAIPIFVTGFADIITWEKDDDVCLVNYRKSKSPLYPFTFDDFLTDFNSSQEDDVAQLLDNLQYGEAVNLAGKLEYDECFGYVPLLALGGSEKVDNLHKMKIIPHIGLITELAGRIQ